MTELVTNGLEVGGELERLRAGVGRRLHSGAVERDRAGRGVCRPADVAPAGVAHLAAEAYGLRAAPGHARGHGAQRLVDSCELVVEIRAEAAVLVRLEDHVVAELDTDLLQLQPRGDHEALLEVAESARVAAVALEVFDQRVDKLTQLLRVVLDDCRRVRSA